MKKILAEDINKLTAILEDSTNICFRVEVLRVDGPNKIVGENQQEFTVISVRLSNGMTISDFEGGKYFEAFRKMPVGSLLSFTFDGQRDAKAYTRQRPTDSGGTVAATTAYNGNLDKVEIFEYKPGSAATVFADLLADQSLKPREVQIREKKAPTASGIAGVGSLEEAAGEAGKAATDLPPEV